MIKKWHIVVVALVVVSLTSSSANAQDGYFLGKDAFTWVKNLDSKEIAQRRGGAFALGKLGRHADSQLPQLLDIMQNDPDASVRDAAAFAVGNICKESIAATQNAEVLNALRKVLQSDNSHWVRRSAAYAIGCMGRFGEEALPELDRAVKDSHPAVRQNVAWTLGQIGRSGIVTLRKALLDDNKYVLRDAAAAIGRMNSDGKQAVPELLRCSGHADAEVRKASLIALVRLVDENDKNIAMAPLRRALSDSEVEVRRNAALAMGNIGGDEAREAVPVLIDALQNGELTMRQQAAAAIRNIGPIASDAVPALRRALLAPDETLRRNAAVALGGIESKAVAAVPELVDRVVDSRENNEVRKEAAVALSRIGSCPAALQSIPKMLAVLTDTSADTQVRAKTLWAIRCHGPQLASNRELCPALEKVLAEQKNSENRLLRYDCAFLLGAFKKDSVNKLTMDTLLEFLNDTSIIIYTGTSTKVTGAGSEKGGGTSAVREMGKGDGRVMAIDALNYIGPGRINERNDIVQQLRAIADDPNTYSNLLQKTKQLLNRL